MICAARSNQSPPWLSRRWRSVGLDGTARNPSARMEKSVVPTVLGGVKVNLAQAQQAELALEDVVTPTTFISLRR